MPCDVLFFNGSDLTNAVCRIDNMFARFESLTLRGAFFVLVAIPVCSPAQLPVVSTVDEPDVRLLDVIATRQTDLAIL